MNGTAVILSVTVLAARGETGCCHAATVTIRAGSARAIDPPSLLSNVAVADQRRIEVQAAEIISRQCSHRPRGVPLPNSLRISNPRLAAPECTTNRLRMF